MRLPTAAVAFCCVLLAALVALPASADRVLVESPPVGEEQVKDIGDTLYETSDQAAVWVLQDSFRQQIRKKLAAAVPRGTVLTEWSEEHPGYACSPQDEPVIQGRMLGFQIAEAICFRDVDDDGRFDEFYVGPGGTVGSGTVTIDVEGDGPAYGITSQPDEESFRRELLYLGVDGGTLRIQYREFAGDFVRPAFDQLVTYPLSADGTGVVRFRGLEIQVHDTSGGQIRYTVVSGMRR